MINANCRNYDLIDYFDVWYNDIDGWFVNNQTVILENITISDDTTEEEIINYLKENNLLVDNCKIEDFDICFDFGFIEITEKENGKPLYCFMEKLR